MKTKHMKRHARIPMTALIVGAIVVFLIVAGGLTAGFLAGMRVGKSVKAPVPTPTQTAVAPTETPTPTATPTPEPPKPQAATQPAAGGGCSKFRPENGPVFIRVNLQPQAGAMVGRTVVRVIPAGSCPGESATVEHWMADGELSWTTPSLNPGRYKVEVANGNYNGVVSEFLDLVEGGYEYTIQAGG